MRFVGWSVMNAKDADSCFGTFEREESAYDCAANLRLHGNLVRIEEYYVPDERENLRREVARLSSCLAQRDALVNAARAVVATYLDKDVCSPGPRFEPLIEALAERVREVDGG
jgi:hypothetical protein